MSQVAETERQRKQQSRVIAWQQQYSTFRHIVNDTGTGQELFYSEQLKNGANVEIGQSVDEHYSMLNDYSTIFAFWQQFLNVRAVVSPTYATGARATNNATLFA